MYSNSLNPFHPTQFHHIYESICFQARERERDFQWSDFPPMPLAKKRPCQSTLALAGWVTWLQVPGRCHGCPSPEAASLLSGSQLQRSWSGSWTWSIDRRWGLMSVVSKLSSYSTRPLSSLVCKHRESLDRTPWPTWSCRRLCFSKKISPFLGALLFSFFQSLKLFLWQIFLHFIHLFSGQYCFEVKVTDGLLRVGWAAGTASKAIGTDAESFGFGGTGKKSCLAFEELTSPRNLRLASNMTLSFWEESSCFVEVQKAGENVNCQHSGHCSFFAQAIATNMRIMEPPSKQAMLSPAALIGRDARSALVSMAFGSWFASLPLICTVIGFLHSMALVSVFFGSYAMGTARYGKAFDIPKAGNFSRSQVDLDMTEVMDLKSWQKENQWD